MQSSWIQTPTHARTFKILRIFGFYKYIKSKMYKKQIDKSILFILKLRKVYEVTKETSLEILYSY